VGLFLAFALLLPLQSQGYSTLPVGPKAKTAAAAPHVKNAMDYTSDGEFIFQSAESNNLFIDTLNWAKDHAEDAEARRVAHDLLAIHIKFADDIRRIANRKHITLPAPPAKTQESSNNEFFIQEAGAHVDVQSARFANEAKSGKDSDIRNWAESKIPVFDRDRTAMLPTGQSRTRR
jgi:hypothetical protein